MFNKISAFFGSLGLIGVVMYWILGILGIIGYFWNIFKIIHMVGEPITNTMLVIRLVGTIGYPLGMIIGWY